MNQAPILELNQVECRHDDQLVVDGIGFSLLAGESACLLGPSGCGKTTLLRAIAGLEPIYQGEIRIHGNLCSSANKFTPPEKRHLGLVFQDHALFPHLSIADNVGFGLRKLSHQDKTSRVQECLELVGLEGLGERFPHQISGGQQQRVALARTIAPKPKLILLDEAFSSLDTHLRRSLARELKQLLKSQGIASLLVTHDQQEAFAMADYIGVMHQGQLLQWDTPYNLYHQPADPQIAAFIGDGHFINGVIHKDMSQEEHSADDTPIVSTALGDFPIANVLNNLAKDKSENGFDETDSDRYYFSDHEAVLVLMRPDDITPNQSSSLRAKVTHKVFRGAIIEYELELPNKETLKALFASHHDYPLTQDIGLDLDVQHLIVYPNKITL
ncbi:ABC transporter ATP-binding protein [Kangiella sp. HZ709]|uniref:ABC transporter ATP-binding protein n=1 Tax=Kangiella sp. HZ709 TaxID=2666328 RepID=UPI0012AF3D23|nr:ABC transporter ATP-binding protein [Kangiella sp. HZ709]MRX27210.1 ATP-binding cassette domain-containing protein [Kangiella sp. HZ709]